MSLRCRLSDFVLLVLAAAVAGCGGGEGITGPTTGTLEITTATTGVDLDTDGYTLQLDAEPARPLASVTTIRLTEITVELNC